MENRELLIAEAEAYAREYCDLRPKLNDSREAFQAVKAGYLKASEKKEK